MSNSDNVFINGKSVLIDSLHGTSIIGTLYLNNINVNTVLENAPTDLDELKEIAANLKTIPMTYFNKITEETQHVVGNVRFNNLTESDLPTSGAVVVHGEIGRAHV